LKEKRTEENLERGETEASRRIHNMPLDREINSSKTWVVTQFYKAKGAVRIKNPEGGPGSSSFTQDGRKKNRKKKIGQLFKEKTETAFIDRILTGEKNGRG